MIHQWVNTCHVKKKFYLDSAILWEKAVNMFEERVHRLLLFKAMFIYSFPSTDTENCSPDCKGQTKEITIEFDGSNLILK